MSRQELIAALEKHEQTLEGFYKIIHQPNTRMSPGEKLLLIAARCILHDEKPNEKGLVRLPYDRAATFIGMSESSANRYSTALAERYNAYKESVPYTTLKGQDCLLTYVKPDDLLWNEPWNVEVPEEKERVINGNLPCPHCGSEGTYRVVKKHVIAYQEIRKCSICNYKEVSEVIPENEPLTPTEKGPQPEDPFEESEKAPISDALTCPITTQEECITESEVEEKKVSSLESFSYEEWLQQRIGHGPIIVSTGNLQEPKYITRPAAYTSDLAAYLAGHRNHIYGSRPALPDGTTHLLGFDIEDPTLDKSHKYMMFRLALAGIASVYWKRRPGRGHLEVYTDKPVDRKAFYAYVVGPVSRKLS